MDNGTMLKVLLKSNKDMIKGLINLHQLQENKSFIRALVDEYNVLMNTSTNDIRHRYRINYRINKLKLIDSLL